MLQRILAELKDPDPQIRLQALYDLRQIKYFDIVRIATNMLSDSNSLVRRESIYCLKALKIKDAQEKIRQMLIDKKECIDVKRVAASYVRELKIEEDWKIFEELLFFEDEVIRNEAILFATSWQKIKDYDYICQLAICDPSLLVRQSCIKAIRRIQDFRQPALNAIYFCIRDEDLSIRLNALRALALSNLEMNDVLVECLENPIDQVQLFAITQITIKQLWHLIPKLIDRLKQSSDAEVRARILSVFLHLGKTCQKDVQKVCEYLLFKDPSPLVRGRAANVLGQFRSRESIGPLYSAMVHEQSIEAKCEIVLAFEKLPSKNAIKRMYRYYSEDPHIELRIACLKSICQQPTKRLLKVKILAEALISEERLLIIESLKQIEKREVWELEPSVEAIAQEYFQDKEIAELIKKILPLLASVKGQSKGDVLAPIA